MKIGKLIELSESKPPRLSEDAVYMRKEIINAIKKSEEKVENFSRRTEEQMGSYSARTDEKMDKFSAINHELSRTPNTRNELNH